MVIKRLIIGMVAFAALLSFFYLKDSEIVSPTVSETITSNGVKPDFVNKTAGAKSITTAPKTDEFEAESVEIDYLSFEEVLAATEQEAMELLARYKFHESNDSAESHFSIFFIKQSCTGIKFEDQQDLDNWIAEDKWSYGREKMNFEAMEAIMRFARCREVVAYVGDKELKSAEFKFSSLVEAEKKGHPIAKLLLHRSKLKSLDSAEFTKLFSDAYAYSKDYPQYKAELYSTAWIYLSIPAIADSNEVTAQTLRAMAMRDNLIFTQYNFDPKMVYEALQEKLDKHLLPLEIDQIQQRMREISEAMENGDWSWLKNNESET